MIPLITVSLLHHVKEQPYLTLSASRLLARSSLQRQRRKANVLGALMFLCVDACHGFAADAVSTDCPRSWTSCVQVLLRD